MILSVLHFLLALAVVWLGPWLGAFVHRLRQGDAFMPAPGGFSVGSSRRHSGQIAALGVVGAWALLRAAAAIAGFGPISSWMGVPSLGPADSRPWLAAFWLVLLTCSVLAAIAWGLTPKGQERAHSRAVSFFTAGVAALAVCLVLAAAIFETPTLVATRLPADLFAASAVVLSCLLYSHTGAFGDAIPSAPRPSSAISIETDNEKASRALLAGLKDARILKADSLFMQSEAQAASPAQAKDALALFPSALWAELHGDRPAPRAMFERWGAPPAHASLVPYCGGVEGDCLLELMCAGGWVLGERLLVLHNSPDAADFAARAAAVAWHYLGAERGPVARSLAELEALGRAELCPVGLALHRRDTAAMAALLLQFPSLRPISAASRVLIDLRGSRSAIELAHLGFSLRTYAAVRAWAGARGGYFAASSSGEGARRWLAEVLSLEVSLDSPAWPRSGAASWYHGVRLTGGVPAQDSLDRINKLADASGDLLAVEQAIPWLSPDELRAPIHALGALPLAGARWLLGDAADLVARSRMAEGDGMAGSPIAVFSLVKSPVSTFLEREWSTLKDSLPDPCWPFPRTHRLLAQAHFDAAVTQGILPEAVLRWVFGDGVVDSRLREVAHHRRGSRVMHAPSAEALYTGGPVPQSAHGRGLVSHSTAISVDVLELVDGNSNHSLAFVDRRLAPTTYYPGRVFSLGSKRYQVPARAPEPGVRRLGVALAASGLRPTWPLRHTEVTLQALGDARMLQKGRLALTRVRASVEVYERVTGACEHGSTVAHLRFEPVEARYNSEAVAIGFAALSHEDLQPLAILLDALLPLFVHMHNDEVEVVALRAGVIHPAPMLAFVDRAVGGAGFAAALDDALLFTLIQWARQLIARCPCSDGCADCIERGGGYKDAILNALSSSAS